MYRLSILLASLSFGGHVANAFYLPGVAPQSFSAGDEVKLKVNKVTSHSNLLSLDYYHFPFCQPEDGPKRDNENLGEFLAGDRIESSPYILRMKEEMYCEQVCVADLGDPASELKKQKDFWKNLSKKEKEEMEEAKLKGETFKPDVNLVAEAIRQNYNNNWIVDNLPSATKLEDSETVTTAYSRGFPIGYVGDDKHSYVFNHMNIEIMYHPVLTENEKFRIVRFTVEPFSIAHSFKNTKDEDKGVYQIRNPISSCMDGSDSHTSFDMVTKSSPQEASGEVLFTYDVTWIENLDLPWASRWDIYLSTNDAVSGNVHWSSMTNSFYVVFLLTLLIARRLINALKTDIAIYNSVSLDEEMDEDIDETGWKLVYADVFRPPSFSPLLLSVAAGTGAQLLCMACITIGLAALGFLNPSYRGALLGALIVLYALMGVVSGYATARLYKALEGKKWKLATTLTATMYPGLAFLIFFVLDLVAWYHNSTDAVPFTTIISILFIWFGLSSPLVYLGSYLGYKKETFEFAVRPSKLPRNIPPQPWYLNSVITAVVGAAFPFGAAFVEMYYIMSSMWMGQYYYVFGILFVVFILLIITCAEVSILLSYFQLCAEDYNWWWRSFVSSGTVAFYFFLQAIQCFSLMEGNSMSTYMLYFGYMGLLCVGLFLMTGSVGFFAVLWFNSVIYGSIKID